MCPTYLWDHGAPDRVAACECGQSMEVDPGVTATGPSPARFAQPEPPRGRGAIRAADPAQLPCLS